MKDETKFIGAFISEVHAALRQFADKHERIADFYDAADFEEILTAVAQVLKAKGWGQIHA